MPVQGAPLDCVTAGYFARVVGMLLFRRTGEVMAFLQGRRHLLGRLVAHLDTASIFEILIRLTGAEEQTGLYLPPSQVRAMAAGNELKCMTLQPGRIVSESSAAWKCFRVFSVERHSSGDATSKHEPSLPSTITSSLADSC